MHRMTAQQCRETPLAPLGWLSRWQDDPGEDPPAGHPWAFRDEPVRVPPAADDERQAA